MLPHESLLTSIRTLKDKEAKNVIKRSLLPAASLENTDILSIDIDNLEERSKLELINKISKWEYTWKLAESVGGNLVIYIKWDRNLKKFFDKLYYHIWLELTMLLTTPIDFLPELDRLRYVSKGQIYFENDDSKVWDTFINISSVPYIATSKKGKERANFGSR